jgi:hypothetical protein
VCCCPQDIAFEAGLEISAHILAVIPAAVVGLVCGLLGIGFVLLNIKITRLRDVLLARFKWRRCIEPCVLVVVYVTGTMLLPRLFPCTPTHCVTYNHQVYCNIQNLTAAAEGTAPPPNTPPLQLPLYTCSIVSADTNQSWIPSSGTITPDTPTNASAIVYYNELATLMLNTGAWVGGWVGQDGQLVQEAPPCVATHSLVNTAGIQDGTGHQIVHTLVTRFFCRPGTETPPPLPSPPLSCVSVCVQVMTPSSTCCPVGPTAALATSLW